MCICYRQLNEKDSGSYTEVGYFTLTDDFARDISDVFNVITGYSLPAKWKRIISAPYDLRQYFFDLIDKEMDSRKNIRTDDLRQDEFARGPADDR